MKSLVVPGTLDSLDDIAEYVKQAATAAGLDKKTSYRLRLAVDEIATNIVTHGYAESGLEGTVNVWAEVGEKALKICLEDTAIPYNPLEQARPDHLNAPLEIVNDALIAFSKCNSATD